MSLPRVAQLEFDDVETVTSETVHVTYDWDFEEGDFKLSDGQLIPLTGLDYLKVWIQKALRTVYKSLIYTDLGYGSEHSTLIGNNFKSIYSQAEYERMIQECLLENDAITQVNRFSFSQTGARLIIQFNVTSIYGTTGGEVII